MFKNVTVYILLGLIIITAAGCGRKGRVTVGDNITEETSVTSVVQSREPSISEGNNAFLRGDFQGAVAYYEQGLRQNRSVAYYNIGVSYYMMQDIAEAEKYFRLAVEEDPTFDEAIMNLVATLAEQEKSVEAERYISRLVSKKKTARVYVDMANLSLKNGSTAKAAFYYENAMKIDNESDIVLSNYANFLISIGELDAGESLLNNITDKNFPIFYNLAYIAWIKGQKDAAYGAATLAANSSGDSEEGNNKLAALFADMKRYPDEAKTLQKLIAWSPKKEYRLRLVYSYLHAMQTDKADDEATRLLKEYPDDIDVIMAFYDMTISKGKVPDAGHFIRTEYSKNPADRLLYQTVRHISLYERNKEAARRLVAVQRDSHLLNLARTAYYISVNDLASAAAALAKVPEDVLNDYYIYKSFLLFKNSKLNEAELVARKIDESKPEYFWYHFFLAWNLHKPERLLELINYFREDYIIAARAPKLAYRLNPIPTDMTFSFGFDGAGADIAATLLYPFFVEPDEIYQFLAMGYMLLKENDSDNAIKKLEKSIEYSKGIKLNNDGVQKLASFKYKDALADFYEADKMLPQNLFVQYNIGLTLFRNGEFLNAAEYFQKSISLNRYFVPAYVGRGLCMRSMDNVTAATGMFDAALINASEYYGSVRDDFVLPMITQARYLAMFALNRMNEIVAAVDEEPLKDNFLRTVSALAKYKLTTEEEQLDFVRNSNVYHAKELAYLLNLYYGTENGAKEQLFTDRNTVLAAKYINAFNNKTLNELFLEPFMNDASVLTDLANISVFLRSKADGLRYLQALSRLNIRYAPQYKASFYYFMWIKDFINSEASYISLENLGYYDQDVHYYMALYFLLNYNQQRLAAQIEDYVGLYPSDYRGKLLSAFQNFENGNLSVFLQSIASLLGEEPFLFNKMPLEIDFERF